VPRSLSRKKPKPEYDLVPIRSNTRGFPKVNYSVPDSSFWRVERWTNRPVALVTITPDGVELGWDTCGACSVGLLHCACKAGISLPNAIGYIFTTRGGVRPEPPPLAVEFTAPMPRRPLSRKAKPKRALSRKVGEPPAKQKRKLRRL
jgi:hypothetical protein